MLDGASLGLTSPTAIDTPTFSSGHFSAFVTAGDHVLGVWDFIATYYGFTSPYGGTVDADFLQANVDVQVAGAVPEPDSLALLGVAVAGVLLLRRSGATGPFTRTKRAG